MTDIITIDYFQAGIDYYPKNISTLTPTCSDQNIELVESTMKNESKNKKPTYGCDITRMNDFTCPYIRKILSLNSDVLITSELCNYNFGTMTLQNFAGQYYYTDVQ